MIGMQDQYNSELSPEEQEAFATWAKANNRMNDLYDYDMQGWWKENQGKTMESGEHFTDKFKKPNHPSFSNESIYHGVDGNLGGEWREEGGKTIFVPGASNLGVYGPLGLQEYFQRNEPDVRLQLPEGQ